MLIEEGVGYCAALPYVLYCSNSIWDITVLTDPTFTPLQILKNYTSAYSP